MHIKGIVAEDFTNYKKPSMFIITCYCDFKCCTEQNVDVGVCQNAPLAQAEIKNIPVASIYEQYVNNPITKAIVLGGMEPMSQIEEIDDLIWYFRRRNVNDPFIIYTGYYPEEIKEPLDKLRKYDNIIIKYGRFLLNKPSRYDEVLGITLASDNQFAEVLS